jgi:hypothetical protein
MILNAVMPLYLEKEQTNNQRPTWFLYIGARLDYPQFFLGDNGYIKTGTL